MSDQTGGSDPRRADTASDEDRNDASDAGTRTDAPTGPDSKEGVRTGESKAAINREVDPPA
jgi:hypothetical protein